MIRLLFPMLLCSCAVAGAPYDLLIRHGKIIDGTGTPWFYGDVAVRDGKIASIGQLGNADSAVVIDASHRVVAPGFIDVHTHADDDLLRLPQAENFVRNGVTTIVVGNCGGSVRDVSRYFENLRTRGVAVNVATLY
ncbi:MAG: amidohydrolase family protein, partial [Phycisphaerae bacterium]|nr:amidohydrolase family protein [Phycisphaerae bacterium]